MNQELINQLGEDLYQAMLSREPVEQLEPVKAGDFMRVDIGGIGSASVRFV
ncbi:hypothetical protein [Geopseudomonas aromaticivorans]